MRTPPDILDKSIAFFKSALVEDPEWKNAEQNLFIFEVIKLYPEFEDKLMSLTAQQKLELITVEQYMDGCYTLAKEFIATKEN